MRTKLTALLLALAMLLGLASCAGGSARPAAAAAEDEESRFGFVLRQTRDFPLAGAELRLYEHSATGARLMWVANSDTNRVFDLCFLTRAEDDTGLPHVFEHAALKGSEKYPDPGLFFHLLYQTYNTYLNAETGAAYTSYPAASLSEAQLLAYADFYTDSCLHPRVLEDESLFRAEAWRYRLEDAEAPLRIEGTVYSEMSAASNLYQRAYSNMLRAAFPGSVAGNDSGGVPEKIPEMSWEALRDYHARYYHPSNCTVFLYGKIDDLDAFLRLLDGYFSAYERRETDFSDAGWTPVRGEREARDRFPVEEGYDTQDASEFYYVFLCPGLREDPEEEMFLNTLTDLMASENSPVGLCLQEALPAAFLSTWLSVGTPEDALIFNVSGICEEDAPAARAAIDEGLRQIAAEGFSGEMVDALSAELNMSMRLSRENSALGLALLTGQMIPYYAESGRLFSFPDYVEALHRLDEWNRAGEYARVTEKWLLGAAGRVVSVTSPEPGARERLDAAEEERLAAVKAAMSEEEIAALVARTTAPEDEPADDADSLARLQAVTVHTLPEETRRYTLREERGEDGVRYLSAAAEVEDVGMPVVLLDASGVPQEELHWFVLYLSMLGQLDTARHTQEELQTLRSRYFYGGELRQSLMDEYGTKNFRPYLRAAWISSGEDLDKGYELLCELLFETRFDDAEALSAQIERCRVAAKNGIAYGAYNTMMLRSLGAESPLYAYHSYCSGLEYYAFLEETARLVRDDPAAVRRALEQVRSRFFNRTNAVVLFAGEERLDALNRRLAGDFLAALDAAEIEPAVYAFDAPAMREALVVEDTVQYNGLVGSFADMGLAGYAADMDAVASLLSDLVLIPRLREEYGVYSPLHCYDSFAGSYLISYRDPNIEETFSVYEHLDELLLAALPDQETLDGYILSCYSAYAMPEGELSGAIAALSARLCGEPEDLKILRMEQLKALTPERVRGYASAYRQLAENGRRFTVGSESAVSAHAELYDRVLRPFAA